MRSPNTPLDAQFRVDRGGGNSSGSTTVKTSDAPRGSSDRRPIHRRLQTDRAISGRTANRTQTLAGLACRSQVSSRRPNSLASRASVVTAADEEVVTAAPSSPGAAPVPRRPVTGRRGRGAPGALPDVVPLRPLVLAMALPSSVEHP